MAGYELIRGADRAVTSTDWLHSSHSLSFGSYYDPDNVRLGPLLAHNEDVLQPGRGYPRHVHRDTEIVTWVVSGRLRHEAPGHPDLTCELGPGMASVLSAGSGIEHLERSADDQPVRVVQMWLLPSGTGTPARYLTADLNGRLGSGELVTVASGSSEPAALPLRQPAARLLAARPAAGQQLRLPAAELRQLSLIAGSVLFQPAEQTAEPVRLGPGDVVRLAAGHGGWLRAERPAELLIWQLAG